MSIKEKLLKLKEEILLSTMTSSREFEFDACLEDHPVGDQNFYRLYYVNYHRISACDHTLGLITWPGKPFMLPKEMTREEGFKVLSYLTDFIEKRDDTDSCSLRSVRTLDGVLDLERFGFTRVNEDDEDKILNLFTVSGRLLLFKESKFYPQYFEWYVDNVSLEEVMNIYAEYGMEFRDIEWLDSQSDKEYSKLKS